MPNYNIQTFYLTSFAESYQQSIDNPTAPVDNIFDPYTLRNEINQNLSNAPTIINNYDPIVPLYKINNPSY
ncbi:9844_t:CDS:1, partial [Gigaspora rosea]